MMKWSKLPDLPLGASEGRLNGVSAPFAGISDGAMIVAGGCNFPDIPVAEGGTKKYYDEIYGFINEKWECVGKLPEKIAYGVSASTPEGVVCVGGAGEKGASNRVFIIRMKGGKASIELLPDLPESIDNASCAYWGGKIYVAGGNADGKPSTKLYSLDNPMCNSGGDCSASWTRLADLPGKARVQPCMAACEGKLYLAGGFCPASEGEAPVASSELLVYDIDTNHWSIESSVPGFHDGSGRTFTGGSAVSCSFSFGNYIIFAGGVNQTIFLDAVKSPMTPEESKCYLTHPVSWYRFNREMLSYNISTKEWHIIGESDNLARAGAAMLVYGEEIVIINGELKPGIRTPEVNITSGLIKLLKD